VRPFSRPKVHGEARPKALKNHINPLIQQSINPSCCTNRLAVRLAKEEKELAIRLAKEAEEAERVRLEQEKEAERVRLAKEEAERQRQEAERQRRQIRY
jgi:hypothetical protein